MYFAENEDWCDAKYDVSSAVNASAETALRDQNSKCKRTGIFEPWTIAGRIERGLLDDTALRGLVKAVKNIAKPDGTVSAPPKPAVTQADMMTYGVLGVAGVLGAMVLFGGKKGKGGRRRRRR